jgi:hypothetical protein
MNALVPVADIEKMAIAIAQSNFFGMKTKEQAMALMFIAQAEGKHPATAAQEYHVIQGKPALKADAMLARFQAAGGKVEWKEYTDKEVTGVFSHPQGGSVTITWTLEMAAAAKLATKDTWKQYPRQMLRARVISEGIRTVYPGIAVGVYTPEEVQDFDQKDKPMVDVTPAAVTDDGEIIRSESPPAYTPSDPLRPHKDAYVVPAPIMVDGTLDFDAFAADLESKIEGAKNNTELSLWNRANSKTMRAMEKERPELFESIGESFRQMAQALM